MRIRFHPRVPPLVSTAALVLCIALLPGCGGGGPGPGPGPGGGGGGTDPWSLDGEFAEIEAEAPGFGGYFFAGDGTLTVYVQDPATQGPAARDAVARRTAGRGRSSRMPTGAAEIRVQRGTYAFSQLQAWRTRLAPILLARADVVYLDVAEDGNALRIGVLPDTEASVQARVAAEGVPGGAFAIVAAEAPRRLQHTLRENAWERGPGGGVPGGYLVHWNADGRTGYCALGFNVHLLPIRDPASYTGGYVTASHCSDVQGARDRAQHYQPENPHHLGSEVRDPAFVTGGECPAGRRCRWSDAAVFTHSPGRLLDIGLVARVGGVGSSEVAGSPLRIQGKRPFPVAGEIVDKVGPGSGLTFGRVYATCADVNVADSDIVLFCQDVMDHPASTGESGSPVYVPRTADAVDLAGLLWGGTAEVGWFSSVRGMERELGDLEVGG
jgi:hypothetical protein